MTVSQPTQEPPGQPVNHFLGVSLENKRVHVSNGALLLPCAFPAAEEEAEAGLRGQSGALSSREELFGEEAVLLSAVGAEEEHEA